MAEHEAERDLLVEALLLLRQRQVELEQRVTALEAASGSAVVEPSAALRGLVDELRGSAPAAGEPAVQTQPEQAVAEPRSRVVDMLRPRHLDTALIALGVLVLVYAGLYQLAQALGFA